MGSGDVWDRLLNTRSTVLGAMGWMIGLSFVLGLFLSWIPLVGLFIGPVVAGYVGGRRAGGPGPALLAAIIPGLVCGGGIFLVGTVIGAYAFGPFGPLLGMFAGALGFMVYLMVHGALLVAALAGGLTASPSASY